jgi:hypothetical protein
MNAPVITQAAGQETSTTSPRLFAERARSAAGGEQRELPVRCSGMLGSVKSLNDLVRPQ